jgi:sugar transferase (PEP-CTERM/EpsH1 system associated)
LRVLLLTHRCPYPPDKGDKIRSFHWLRALAARHEVHLVTHADDPRDLRHVAELARLCRSVSVHPVSRSRRLVKGVAALASGRPLSFAKFREPAAAAEVARLLEREPPDVVVAYSAQPAEYLPARPGIPVVVDLVDVDSEKWSDYARRAWGPMRAIYAREARLVRRFERDLADRGFRLVLIAGREARLFQDVVADVPVTVVPNGVEAGGAPSARDREPGRLVFVGAMDYAANRDAAAVAARDVLPLVRRTRHDASLSIVGRNPGSLRRALGSLPGVEVTGEVADVAEHLDRAAASLLPLRTVRGVPNKLLEALARGVPVVTTRAALDAIEAEAGTHALAAESADGLAQAVLALLGDAGLAARIGAAGRALVRERYRWERTERAFQDLVEQSAVEAARP